MSALKKILENEHFLVAGIGIVFLLALLFFFPNEISYWLAYWWMFPIALAIAITVNTVGISGAALFVPFFILVFPFLAGTSLLAEQSVKLGLITESFGLSSSALAFFRYGLVDKKLGFSIILGAFPFVIIGAVLTFLIPQNIVKLSISFVLLLSVYLLLNKERAKSKLVCIEKNVVGKHHHNHDNGTLTSKDGKTYKYCRQCGKKKRFFGYSLGGLFQGMSGFGIGELGIVSMVTTAIPIRVAIGTSHLIVASTAIIASATHLIQSNIDSISTPWNIIFMTVPAVIIGGQIAPYISAKIKSSYLEYLVAALFVVLAFSLAFIALR